MNDFAWPILERYACSQNNRTRKAVGNVQNLEFEQEERKKKRLCAEFVLKK